MKKLLTGDEAIARGAYEAGVRFASAYPGTPSTEILENLAGYEEINAEWAPNEKVALESAIGASIAGARSMASMKHVGVNVAADPMFAWSYIGVNGGAVLITADDPGMHSSQNEQDNRNYAKAAKLAMFEPSDSQECLDMMKQAFELSESYDIPVMVRMTTRVCHSKSIVEIGERTEVPLRAYEKNMGKYVTLPAISRRLRVELEEKLERLEAYSENCPWNYSEGSGKIGVIASGISYFYAKEVFGEDAAYLKLGYTNPLPKQLIDTFCKDKEIIYVLEENDPYLADFVERLGYMPKRIFPFCGELTPDVLRKALYGETLPTIEFDKSKLIRRAPSLCAGCPHRGLYYRLGKRKDVMVCGDIGCYTLGAGKPFSALDTTICMGASISAGHGASKVNAMKEAEGLDAKKVVTVIGDSTFFHTGINSLMNSVYNNSNAVSIILDNRITGMTGHQNNPGTGFTAKGDPAALIDMETLVRAIGVKLVKVIDPNCLDQVDAALDECLAYTEGPSVIITRYPCVLKKFSQADKDEFAGLYQTKNVIDPEKCIGCKLCLKAGCPAMRYDAATKKVIINRVSCVGCDVCAQVCPKGAIGKEA